MRIALSSLLLSFRSQRLLAGTDIRNVRLLCAPLCWGVSAWSQAATAALHPAQGRAARAALRPAAPLRTTMVFSTAQRAG